MTFLVHMSPSCPCSAMCGSTAGQHMDAAGAMNRRSTTGQERAAAGRPLGHTHAAAMTLTALDTSFPREALPGIVAMTIT